MRARLRTIFSSSPGNACSVSSPGINGVEACVTINRDRSVLSRKTSMKPISAMAWESPISTLSGRSPSASGWPNRQAWSRTKSRVGPLKHGSCTSALSFCTMIL